ncbi:hypothetical protein T552_02125 [Pneumocystis carinii B80]|uniref:Translation initiation factor eIF2B subunit epsilon n=1 Tax=Pneumocystis carinii (strain B80) TaxID=1408658 RepID=A0A0W4ZH48_PNEC8|nr:hypothetical protein T552_02125 [Pneumocystis carinii B80]KTW27685.1 hypothetical protein T552_02125 [Pneumocystis carinii B80]
MVKASKSLNTKLDEPKQALRAIVLTDSFGSRFKPLTLEKPRCLIELANIPLIEYTFEFLALGGVQEVYIFCHEHGEEIKEYIEKSKWNDIASPFSVQTIISSENLSAGDVLRELDARKWIESDFLLINGDVVSNISLKEVISEHNKRRQTDKNAIMSILVQKVSPFHRIRIGSEASIFVIDSDTSKCLHYETIKMKPRTKSISIDGDIFNKHEKVEIRNDLIDCQIDICSPEVPALFTENFDYQDIRKDFVHGILTSDLLRKTIYCHVIEDNYAACVQNLQAYNVITKDVISRWSYPFVPDSNLLFNQSFKYMRGHIYKEDNVILSRSVNLKSKVVIGSGTMILENTVIMSATIGRNCLIGDNVVIENSFIWNNVTIGDGCKISNSIIADNVILGKNCIIQEGAIISFGVEISNGMVISGNIRLTNFLPEKHIKNNTFELTDTTVVGVNGKGYIYQDLELSDDEDAETESIDCSSLVYNLKEISISDTSLSSISSKESNGLRRRSSTTITIMSDESDATNEYFYREALAGLEQAFDENHMVDSVLLEMHSLRMSTNVSYSEVRSTIIMAFLNYILKLVSEEGKSIADIIEQNIKKWIILLKKMTFSNEDKEEIILTLQESCSKRIEYMRFFPRLLKLFYNEDIVEEDDIYSWFDNSKSQTGSIEKKRLYNIGSKFVTWLKNAEEDSTE